MANIVIFQYLIELRTQFNAISTKSRIETFKKALLDQD